jgi:hypothetical protein
MTVNDGTVGAGVIWSDPVVAVIAIEPPHASPCEPET